MSNSYEWKTEDELKHIDALDIKGLSGYLKAAESRMKWGKVRAETAIAYAKKRLTEQKAQMQESLAI